jgi:hypothetical protein
MGALRGRGRRRQRSAPRQRRRSSRLGRSTLCGGPGRGQGREVVRWVMDESRCEAEAILQSAAVPVSDVEAQLSNAGVLLRQGLSHGEAARQELGRRVLRCAGREVGRRLEQTQAEALLFTIRLQGGDRAAELEHLELEAVGRRGAGSRGGCGHASWRSRQRLGDRGVGDKQPRRGGPALRRTPRAGLEAGDHLPLEDGLGPRLAQGPPRQVRHVRGVSW